MITTFQLAQRVAQRMFGQDSARLPITKAEDLRDALNFGLDEFAKALPDHRKIRPMPAVLDEPRAITLNVTAGSATVSIATALPFGAYTVAADLIGRGLVIAGMPNVNRLISSTAMLMPYLGATGSVAATVYADGVPLPARVERVASGVAWLREGSSDARELRHHADFPRTSAYASSGSATGDPSVWWVEPVGGTDAQDVKLVLRVWPLPTTRGTLIMSAMQFAAPVTMDDLHITTRALPVDEMELGFLAAICASHLLGSPGLRSDIKASQIETAADRARLMLAARANNNPSGEPNRYGTPDGY